jgi:hypothetical protein
MSASMENKPKEVLTEVTEAPTEITEPKGAVQQQAPTITRHAILHSSRPAMCCMGWDELEGDDVSRVCPQCGATAYRVESMTEAEFVEAARHHRADFLNTIAFRKIDGTYVFTTKNCSPKQFLASQKDLRGSMIANWWYDRFSRYNWYLLLFGLLMGTITTAITATSAGQQVLIAFIAYALACATVGNLLFGIAILINIMIPKAIAPARRYAGPILLVASLAGTAIVICWPLWQIVLAQFRYTN